MAGIRRMTGSEIAIGGFENEDEVAGKFNNWKTDEDAQRWLEIMMYDLEEIEEVHAEKIGQRGFKSDINVVINIAVRRRSALQHLNSIENIQVKLVTGDRGFNQVEKKKVDGYVENWHIPADIQCLLKLYDGEEPPRPGCRHDRRMFVDEFTEEERNRLIEFLQNHIVMIVSDVIRGRGRFAAEWTLVVNKSRSDNRYNWVLISINEAIGIYLGDCKVTVTRNGNIHLGNITLQRKGGDGGRDSANMLQFKADPLILLNCETQFNSNCNGCSFRNDSP